MTLATNKSKVSAYLDPEVKELADKLAKKRVRSLSNLLESLIVAEIQKAQEAGEI